MKQCSLYQSLKTFILLLLLVLSLGGLDIYAATPVPFIFFNNTRFTNRTLLDTAGAMRSTVVYDVWGMTCTATACSNVPSQTAFLQTVASYVADSTTGNTGGYGSNYLIVLDFEAIVVDSATSQAQATLEENLLAQFCTWVHGAYPTAKVGMYDYDYSTNYQSTRALLYGTGGFDVFAPSLYQRWSSHTTWNTNMNAAINNDLAINSSLPIYPYISPYTAGSTTDGLMTGTEWQSELTDLTGSSASGAVLWTGSATINTSDAWYTEWLAMLSPAIDTSKTYIVKNEHNAYCTAAQSTSSGSVVEQTTCASPVTALQEWNLQTTSTGKFYLTNTAAATNYLSVNGDSVAAGALLEAEIAGSSGPSSGQTWHVVSAGKKYYSKGYYVLIGDGSNKCMEAPASGLNAQIQDDNCSSSTTQLYSIVAQ